MARKFLILPLLTSDAKCDLNSQDRSRSRHLKRVFDEYLEVQFKEESAIFVRLLAYELRGMICGFY
jgi:hypothetical protein